jgi:replicative DNA helicase
MTTNQHIELEQALLGAILVNSDAYFCVRGFLLPKHFGEPVHRRILDVAAALIEAGAVATPITVRHGFASDLMVAPDMRIWRYLAHCAANAVLPIENVVGHAVRIIAQANMRREW